MDRIAPSVQIEAAIEAALLKGLEEPERLCELGRLGARVVLQRAVEDELEAFLGRSRYERTETAAGSRNGHRPRRIQTAEGEITIAMPQVRDSLTRFVSATIPDTRAIVRTRPLEVLVIQRIRLPPRDDLWAGTPCWGAVRRAARERMTFLSSELP